MYQTYYEHCVIFIAFHITFPASIDVHDVGFGLHVYCIYIDMFTYKMICGKTRQTKIIRLYNNET